MWPSILLVLSIAVAASAQGGNGGGTIYNLNFTIPANVPVCGSVNIEYDADIPSDTLLPIVLAIGYSGNGVSVQLTNSADFGAGGWTWDPVNVPTGLYQIHGRSISGDFTLVGSSDTFAVIVDQSGPSQSCLSQPQPSSLSAAPPTTPTTSPSSVTLTSDIGVGTSMPVPSSAVFQPSVPSSNATAVGVDSGSSSPSISTGVKAGVGVVGALIAISALTALYWYCMSRRRHVNNVNKTEQPPSGAGAGGGARRWTGLASVDEYHGQGYTTTSASRETKSYGTTNYPATPTAVASNGAHSPNFNEKPSPVSPFTSTYADGLSYPPQDISPGQGYFPSRPYNSNNSPPHTPIYSSPAVGMMRSGSHSSTNSRARSTAGSSSSDFPYPIAGVNGVPIPEGRSGSGDNRKGPIARKPVPSYNSEQHTPEDEYPVYNANRYSSNTLDNPFVGSSESHDSHLSPPQPVHHELQHKASFGEKPMQHVLIPDMPPPRVASPPIVGVGR